MRCSRADGGSDVRWSVAESRRDLALDRGEGFINECLSVLRVTVSELWKHYVDRIELGDDMTHDPVGAETVGEIDPLPQRLVRCCAEVNANQDGSLELHSHSRMKTPASRATYRATAYAETWSTRSIMAVAVFPISAGFRG